MMCVKHCVCLSVCLLVVCLAVGLYVSLSLSQSVYACLSACLRAFVYLDLSVRQSVCLSVCPLSGGQSITVRTKRAGSGGEDAESERAEGYAHKSNRLRTQERQVGLMIVELRTEAESWRLRARS